MWKTSLIIPLFKAGGNGHVSHYRLICLIPAMCKVLESIVTGSLLNIFKNVISVKQDDLFQGRSSLRLAMSTNQIAEALRHGDQVDTIYIHFCKAIDRVGHN